MKDMKQTFIIHARPLAPNPVGGLPEARHWSATRGATFAIKKNGKVFHKFYVGTALCGKKDNFNRKIGRTIALSRVELVGKRWEGKGLSSALSYIGGLCAKHGYLLPEKSFTYIEETFNGKADKGR